VESTTDDGALAATKSLSSAGLKLSLRFQIIAVLPLQTASPRRCVEISRKLAS
jgi:hypothetical protein